MTQTDVCDANSLYWCENSVMHRDSLPTSSSNNLKISKSKLSALPMKKVSAANHPPPHWSDSKQWNLKGWRCWVRDLNQITDKNGGCPVTIHNDGLVIYIHTCSVKISCVKMVFILLSELGLMAICRNYTKTMKNIQSGRLAVSENSL